MNELTSRDREYILAIFLLRGGERPVGPSELSKNIGVSRVGALKKMKRLAERGLGEYISHKGLELNDKGIDIVEKDIRRHHLVEEYFKRTLDLDFKKACEESSTMAGSMSDELIEAISEDLSGIECECGTCIEPPYSPDELMNCHWCKEFISAEMGGDEDHE